AACGVRAGRRVPCGGPPRVEDLPQAVEVVGRVARMEALELRVEREALTHLHAAVHHTCVEAVERAHRRPAYNAALGVIDAAVAGADEALGRLHVAHRAAEVRAAGGDGHVWKRRLAL